ncbi:uncharacterized protein LOC128169304 [Crassostrea angulata]|uniref:uncharacterized protein LOC128169304 n=1 Tax=Magallana angulata TaxID=2784310 RepID=UPI0022B1E84D|nr:uncharacterized protein LOC128169304 [Crassostrea angulata]
MDRSSPMSPNHFLNAFLFLVYEISFERTVSSPRTPKRVYSLTDICCLCGFSFVVKEIDREGNVQVKKLFRLKLKVTEEKRNIIQEVMSIHSSAEGVCVKCFSKVENIFKYRREIAVMVSQFEESMRKFKLKATPESSTWKKRALRSPEVSAPELKNTCRSDVTKHGTTQPLHMGHKGTEFKQAKKSLKFVAEDVHAVQHPTEGFKQTSSISSISAEIQHPRLADVTLLEAKRSVLAKTTYRDILPDPKGMHQHLPTIFF